MEINIEEYIKKDIISPKVKIDNITFNAETIDKEEGEDNAQSQS